MMKRRTILLLLAALTLCGIPRLSGASDIPAMPTPSGRAYELPQAQQARFAPNLRFDVYTGPGGQYVREANGRASVSTNDWVLIFGEEDGWLMIAYRVSEDQLRFGFIEATQQQAGVSVPRLAWAGEPVELYDSLVSDPIEFDRGDERLEAQNTGTLLAALGEDWAYVESTGEGGKPVRGFASVGSFRYAPDQATVACVSLGAGESAALYDAPGGEEIGRLYPGATVFIKEERDGMLRVVYYAEQYDYESLDLSVQGWVDAQALTRGMRGWTYLEQQGFEPMRVVWFLGRGDILSEGGAGAYWLKASVGDTVYLDVLLYERSARVEGTELYETTRGMLYLPKTHEGEEQQYVKLYSNDLGPEAVSSKAVYEQALPGTRAWVLTREGGAALVCILTQDGPKGPYWVDARQLVEVM